jgi:hypothetical protein
VQLVDNAAVIAHDAPDVLRVRCMSGDSKTLTRCTEQMRAALCSLLMMRLSLRTMRRMSCECGACQGTARH